MAADQLDKIREKGELVWGGDEEGGGPYVFPDAKDPNKIVGFEVELADLLGQELGVKAVFQQGQWENVPALVDRGTVDVALNGYEQTPQRERDYFCTRPYYAYGLQLLVRRDSWIHNWNDLQLPASGPPAHPAVRVGVLDGSGAETYLKSDPRLNVKPIGYQGQTDSMTQTVNGVIDATLQDDPAAQFYAADQFRDLRRVCVAPSGQAGYYVTPWCARAKPDWAPRSMMPWAG